MDINDRRLASAVGITFEEASRHMRDARDKFSGDEEPTMRQRIQDLRNEEESFDPVAYRRRKIEAALLTDHLPTFRR